MDWTLEVVVLPVSDIDRAIEFYRDKIGFNLDHDTRTDQMHVVQLTPRGSGCSIVMGDLPAQREMTPGSLRGLQLVVSDARAARQELLDRGVEVSDIQVFDERDGGTFFGFSDPDGNTWLLQEVTTRLPGRIDPAETSFASATDLAGALRRAKAAHGEHETRTGVPDEDWPDWYAAYMVAEQAGTELPT